MKICIISNYRKGGYGESTRPYFLSINLLKEGHKIIHLCNHEGIEDGIEYVKVDFETWQPSLFSRIKFFVFLAAKVRLFNPDIIYSHQFNTARWAQATRLLPKKIFVFDAHTSMYFESSTFSPQQIDTTERIKRLEGDICLNADHIICASDETRQILKATYSLTASKLSVVGNATNVDPVSGDEGTISNANTDDAFTCIATLPFDGFVANEWALSYLFEIAALVEEKSKAIKFIVLGGGQKPVPPTKNIIYRGYVPDLRKEILTADICLMPYPDKAVCGGARNKFCDFVALGKIVVSSPEGMRGMQILEDGKNCVVAKDKFDYAQKILDLASNPAKVKTMGQEVLKVKTMFNWKDRAIEVSNIFKALLAS